MSPPPSPAVPLSPCPAMSPSRVPVPTPAMSPWHRRRPRCCPCVGLGCRPGHSGVPPAPPSPGAPAGHPRTPQDTPGFGASACVPPAGGSRGAGSAQESTGGAGAWAGLVLFTEKQLGEGLVAGRSHCHLQFFVTGVLGGAKPSPGPPQLRSRRGRAPVAARGRCWVRGAAMLSPPRDPRAGRTPGTRGVPVGLGAQAGAGGCSSPGHPLLRKRCSVPALQRCHPKANAGSQG